MCTCNLHQKMNHYYCIYVFDQIFDQNIMQKKTLVLKLADISVTRSNRSFNSMESDTPLDIWADDDLDGLNAALLTQGGSLSEVKKLLLHSSGTAPNYLSYK